MKLHEYQSKSLFYQNGIEVPVFRVIQNLQELDEAIAFLGEAPWVMKIQVHSGGRRKSGGVRVVNSQKEAQDFAKSWLNQSFKNEQTGSQALPVNAIMIETYVSFEKEWYLAILLDKENGLPLLMASSKGGVGIEENSKSIQKLWIHPSLGILDFEFRIFSKALGLLKPQVEAFRNELEKLLFIFFQKDLSLLEVNPLVWKDGKFLALDAKVLVDDNALYRQKELSKMKDESQEDPKEAQAQALGLNYVALDGDVGLMVNGAGLAMATMDLIELYGGKSANFLDVGGGVNQESIQEALKIILSNPKVKVIFVNIFGGIVRCDLVAEGLIQAALLLNLKTPLVVRFQGNHAQEGSEKLAQSDLNIIALEDFKKAAKNAVSIAKENSLGASTA